MNSIFCQKNIIEDISKIQDSHLFKVTQRNVSPNISIKINQNVVKLDDRVKKFGHIVMSFNLHYNDIELEVKKRLLMW